MYMDLGAVPSTSTIKPAFNENTINSLFMGVTSFDMHNKKVSFYPVEILPSCSSAIRSKTINANDNFANDNVEFAPMARAAVA